MCGYGELITGDGKIQRGYFVDNEFKGQTFEAILNNKIE